MTDFNGRLADLCTNAMSGARGDFDAQAEIVERLVNATAFSIAMACQGQEKPMQMLLSGAEQQLYEAAAEHARTVRNLAPKA